MPAVNIGVNLGNIQTAADQFAAFMTAARAQLGNYVKGALEFNEANRAMKATLEQIDAAGNKTVTTLDRVAGGFESSSQKITETAKSAKLALEQLNLAAGKAAGDQARNVFPIPSDASVSGILRYNSAINNFQKAVGGAGLSGAALTNLFNQAASSPANFARSLNDLPPATKAVALGMLQVQATAQQLGVEGTKGVTLFGLSVKDLFRILTVQVFRRFVTTLINDLRDGVQSAVAYQIQLQQVANVTGQTAPAAFQNLSNAVRGLSEEFGVLTEDVLKGAQTAITTQAGNSAEGLNVLRQALILSQASGTDLDSSVRLLTTSLEAFHLEAERAGSVANTLFLVAQRSRIPLEEMKNAIGRVSQTATGMNVSVEEASALFLTISQQGGRATEAFALLNQVLGRLQSPTRELQAFLNNLGTPTAEAAKQTFGLVGLLEKLSQAAEANPAALGEMAGSIRTLRALMAVTGDETRVFAENLNFLRTNPTALLNAQGLVAQTPAARIRAEFESIRNIFTQDIGQKFISTVVRLVEALGGAKTAVEGLIGVFRVGVPAYVTYRVAAASIPATMNLIELSTNRALTSTEAFKLSVSQLGILLAGFGAGFTIGQFLFSIGDALDAANVERGVANIRKIQQERDRANEATRAEGERQKQEIAENINEEFRLHLANAARLVQVAHEIKNEFVERQQEISEAFRVQSQSFLDGLRKRVNDTRAAINEAKSDIDAAGRAIQNFQQSASQRTFRTQLGAEEDPVAGITIISRRRTQLLNEAQEGFRSGDRARVEAARATLQEIQQLNDEQTRRELEDQKRTAEFQGTLPIEIRYGQQVRVFHADLTSSLRRENELVTFRTQLETELQNRIRRTVDAQGHSREQQEAAAQTNLRIFEQQLRGLEQFKVFTDTGEFLPQFRNQPGGERAAALRNFDDMVTRLNASGQRQGVDTSELNNLLTQRRSILLGLLDSQELVNRSEEHRRTISQEVTDQIAEQQRLTDLITRSQTGVRTSTQAINQLLEPLANVLPTIAPQNVFASGTRADNEAALRFYNALRASITDVRNAQAALNTEGGRTAANANALNTAVEQLRTNAATFAEKAATSSIPNAVINAVNQFLGVPLNEIRHQVDTIRLPGGFLSDIERFQIAMSAARERVADASGELGGLDAAIARLGPAAATTTATVAGNFANISREINSANAAASRLLITLESLRGGTLGPTIPIEHHAFGGLINGPKGTDTILSWLSPGEFIMPERQTQQFYTQLTSMWRGEQPRYFAGGGPVNVGDINVTVNGGSNSDITIRDIAKGINREVRLGRIKFR